ncbi:TetR/AcrR family transcriptional regulator [Streptomyces olivaceoviridis]
MDDIAQATGLGKGSLYGAFGDKAKLFHRVFGAPQSSRWPKSS